MARLGTLIETRHPIRGALRLALAAAFALVGIAPAQAAGDRLLATWGVTQVEGAGGGGLVPWALVTGSGSRDQIAATAFATTLHTQGGYTLNAAGADWKGKLAGVARFTLQGPGSTRFLLSAISQRAALMQTLATSIQSPAGACGSRKTPR